MSETAHDGERGRDERATRVMSSTATGAFADACELAAIAAQDLHEERQALASLEHVPAATTAMLTAATRSGGTQELPASLRAAALSEAEASSAAAPNGVQGAGDEQDGTADAARSGRTRRRFAVIVALTALVAVAVAAGIWWVAGRISVPDAAAVEQALAADPDIMDGFVANDYVEQADYQLSDVSVYATQAADDGSVLVDATATLANESFESDVTATLLFARASDRDRFPELAHAAVSSSGWAGAVLSASATTQAIAGVNRDPDFADGFDPTFDAASQTCTYTATTEYDLWFGKTTVQTPYTYAFDGTAWVRTAGTSTSSFTYDAAALEGAYAPADGNAGSVQSFKLANVDTASGTFTVEYRIAAPGFGSSAITGVIDCTLAQAEPTGATKSYRQVDGSVYTFTGEGTSSGGAGTAKLEGVLGLDGTIAISFAGDYTRTPLLFGEPSDETMELSGTLARS